MSTARQVGAEFGAGEPTEGRLKADLRRDLMSSHLCEPFVCSHTWRDCRLWSRRQRRPRPRRRLPPTRRPKNRNCCRVANPKPPVECLPSARALWPTGAPSLRPPSLPPPPPPPPTTTNVILDNRRVFTCLSKLQIKPVGRTGDAEGQHKTVAEMNRHLKSVGLFLSSARKGEP